MPGVSVEQAIVATARALVALLALGVASAAAQAATAGEAQRLTDARSGIEKPGRRRDYDCAVTPATSSAAQELERLFERRRSLAGRLDEVEAEQRSVSEALQRARGQLVAVERSGEATDKQRADAKKRLAAADAKQRDPELPARLEGVRLAIADADREITAYVFEHLAALVGPLEDEAREAAAAVDRAAAEVVRAYTERNAVDARLHKLLALGGLRIQPGAIVRTRSEAIYREASGLLMEGEAAPVVDRAHAHSHLVLEQLVARLDGVEAVQADEQPDETAVPA